MAETLGIGLSAFGPDSDVAQVVWQDQSVLVDLRAVGDPPFGLFDTKGLRSIPVFPFLVPRNASLVDLTEVYQRYGPAQLAFTPGSVLVSSLTLVPTDVHKVYVAYYARPADPEGHDYWTSRLEAEGGPLSAIIRAFGTSDEFNRRYGGLGFVELVTRIPPARGSGGLELQVNAPADRCGDVDQRIQREARHPATQQVIHARLSDSTALRRLGLRPAILFDNGRNLPHELGARTQIRRLLGRIGKRIPDARVRFSLAHLRSFINSRNRAFASSMSRCDVRCVFF